MTSDEIADRAAEAIIAALIRRPPMAGSQLTHHVVSEIVLGAIRRALEDACQAEAA